MLDQLCEWPRRFERHVRWSSTLWLHEFAYEPSKGMGVRNGPAFDLALSSRWRVSLDVGFGCAATRFRLVPVA